MTSFLLTCATSLELIGLWVELPQYRREIRFSSKCYHSNTVKHACAFSQRYNSSWISTVNTKTFYSGAYYITIYYCVHASHFNSGSLLNVKHLVCVFFVEICYLKVGSVDSVKEIMHYCSCKYLPTLSLRPDSQSAAFYVFTRF